MRRVALVLLAGLVMSLAAIPAEATTTIDIANFAFSPATKSVPIGSTVTWHNSDGVDHTSTQDVTVWDTGHIHSGANASETVSWAATYPYHCNIHTYMHGVVKVPIQVSPPSGGTSQTFTITFGTAAPPGDFKVTVQERVGTGSWTKYKTGLTSTSTTFKASSAGTYSFRSILVSPTLGKTKPSPKTTITVT